MRKSITDDLPILLYDYRTYMFNKREYHKMETWQRRILRSIVDGKKLEEGWEIRLNVELYEGYKDMEIAGIFGRIEDS